MMLKKRFLIKELGLRMALAFTAILVLFGTTFLSGRFMSAPGETVSLEMKGKIGESDFGIGRFFCPQPNASLNDYAELISETSGSFQPIFSAGSTINRNETRKFFSRDLSDCSMSLDNLPISGADALITMEPYSTGANLKDCYLGLTCLTRHTFYLYATSSTKCCISRSFAERLLGFAPSSTDYSAWDPLIDKRIDITVGLKTIRVYIASVYDDSAGVGLFLKRTFGDEMVIVQEERIKDISGVAFGIITNGLVKNAWKVIDSTAKNCPEHSSFITVKGGINARWFYVEDYAIWSSQASSFVRGIFWVVCIVAMLAASLGIFLYQRHVFRLWHTGVSSRNTKTLLFAIDALWELLALGGAWTVMLLLGKNQLLFGHGFRAELTVCSVWPTVLFALLVASFGAFLIRNAKIKRAVKGGVEKVCD